MSEGKERGIRRNLHTIMQTIQSRDVRVLTHDDISKLYLEIIDKAFEEDSNAKGLEVALKAVMKLADSVEIRAEVSEDEALAARLPDAVLKLVGK